MSFKIAKPNPTIRVYPCENLVGMVLPEDKDHDKRRRDDKKRLEDLTAALGFLTPLEVFPGGWVCHSALLEAALKAALLPVSGAQVQRPVSNPSDNGPTKLITTEQAAESAAKSYMRVANATWKRRGQTSLLFPTLPDFDLVLSEVVAIQEGKLQVTWIIGWRLTWRIRAATGPEAALPTYLNERFVYITGASITLILSLTGRVMGGSAHWHPTYPPKTVLQHQTPDGLRDHILEANAAAVAERKKGGHDHGEEHRGGASSGKPDLKPAADLFYSCGARTGFRNFIDPCLHWFDGHAHGHGPTLLVPSTEHGLSAELLTFSSLSASGRCTVTVHPWVVGSQRTMNLKEDPDLVCHWVKRSLNDPATKVPECFFGGEPLTLEGLYEVSFTVRHKKTGAIAHAQASVCSTPNVPYKPPPTPRPPRRPRPPRSDLIS